MNGIFQKNIQALSIKNPNLAKILSDYIVTDVPQLVKENGFFNFLYKNKYLHNVQNPIAEAKEIFLRTQNTPVTIHFVYGIGLGYLFQIAAQNSLGTVIVFEPDLNILKIAFTLVDFSNEINKKNVYITNTMNENGEILYKKSNTKNLPVLLVTKSCRELDEQKFNERVEELIRMVGSFSLDLKYTQERFYPLVQNIINNAKFLSNDIPLIKVKDHFKDKTAVIVSAGPTLDRNIETIKKYRKNIILIVVGTAMRALSQNNIEPDFLCLIEAYDSTKQLINIDLSNINLVTEPYSGSYLRQFKFKKVFTHISQNVPINTFWKEIIEEDDSEYISKGTVSYTALNTARILGCNKIVFVGQDLAYLEGQCYSKDSAYKDLICQYNKELEKWEITAKNFEDFANALSNSASKEDRFQTAKTRLKNLNQSLYYVKGINGDMVPTESVYAAFIKPFTEFTEKYKNIEYINTSLLGAQIDGFKNLPLEEALNNSKTIDCRELNIVYNSDKNKIKSNLRKNLDLLNQAKELVNNGEKSVKSLNNYIKRYNNATIEVLKELRKASKIYVDITDNYSNTLFDFIISAEKIDIDYEIKMAQEFNITTIKKLSNSYQNYFSKANIKIQEISTLINNAIKDIK